LKNSIKSLGLKHSLATKFTSWIAVKKNEEFASTSMVNVVIPSMNDPKKVKKTKTGSSFFFFILNKKKEPEKKPVVATTTTTTTTTYVEHYDYSYVPVASYVSSGAVSSKKSEAENRASEKSSSYAAPESRASEKSSSHSARDQAQLQASYSSSHDDEEEGSSSYARRSGLKEKLCFPSSSFLLQ
jgi:mRNA deadenylase 3'-5' endonuclease subunit Ccr4